MEKVDQRAEVLHPVEADERMTDEGCHILQAWGLPCDSDLSIARARVLPTRTTAWHLLIGVTEFYLITAGLGLVEIGEREVTEVSKGDLVFIPPDTRQRITNIGSSDLVFYCICQPAFKQDCYVDLEA